MSVHWHWSVATFLGGSSWTFTCSQLCCCGLACGLPGSQRTPQLLFWSLYYFFSVKIFLYQNGACLFISLGFYVMFTWKHLIWFCNITVMWEELNNKINIHIHVKSFSECFKKNIKLTHRGPPWKSTDFFNHINLQSSKLTLTTVTKLQQLQMWWLKTHFKWSRSEEPRAPRAARTL